MAHGRKRSFIAGFLTGGLAVAGVSIALVFALDLTLGPPGYPHFSEASARSATLDWARLSPFPVEAKSFTIVTAGNMFTRQFHVSFFGEPALISQWVKSCPGVADPKTNKEVAPDGTVTYEIPAAGGAAFAELIHHPVRGTISIRAYWS